MPIEVFWEVEKMVKKADYLFASNEESTDINNIYREVLQKVVPFAIHEKDRVWIYEKLRS